MRYWIFPSNDKVFDNATALKDLGYINYNISSQYKVAVGDMVYLYLGKPIGQIQYLLKVLDANVAPEIASAQVACYWREDKPTLYNRWVKLELVAETFVPNANVDCAALRQLGIRTFQYHQLISKDLFRHIASQFPINLDDTVSLSNSLLGAISYRLQEEEEQQALKQMPVAAKPIRSIRELYKEQRAQINRDLKKRGGLANLRNKFTEVLMVDLEPGKFLSYHDGIDTMSEVLRKIGLDKIAEFDIYVDKEPLLTKNPRERGRKVKYHKEIFGWYLLSDFSNLRKAIVLNEIFDRLGNCYVAKLVPRQKQK